MSRSTLVLVLAACSPSTEFGQRSDDVFVLPDTGAATFGPAAGPRVGIDGAHCNYHTASGRYRAFAQLLERDGYRVDGFSDKFTDTTLRQVDVLVISNAISPENERNWALPNHSAFTDAEIESVQEWVIGGGRLLLIADHMPMPGAAAALARVFGVVFHDGFAFGADGKGQSTFRKTDGTLADHAVTRGSGGGEIPFVTTFTGQAFELAPGARGDPLLQFGAGAFQLLPQKAWVFTEATPRMDAGNLLQGILLERGAGRVAVFGEAAGFSAQLSARDGGPMGMNHPAARHNARFLLNVMRWLATP